MKRKYSEERRCAEVLQSGGELSKGLLCCNGSLKNCDFGGEMLFVYQKEKRKKTDSFLVVKCWWLVCIFPGECVDLRSVVLSC